MIVSHTLLLSVGPTAHCRIYCLITAKIDRNTNNISITVYFRQYSLKNF